MLKKIIITAGGTGGHIFPAVAIAEELISRGIDILFVGNSNSMEERVAREKQIPFSPIDVQKLYRSFTFRHVRFPFKLIKSMILSSRIIKKYQPDACIGTGGFVSGPVIFCAGMMKIPVYLQEQNSSVGLTTKLLSKKAKRIFIGYESAKLQLPVSKCMFTGNPLQKSFALEQLSKPENKAGNKPVTLLVLGGSQGARIINESVLESVTALNEMDLTIIWQTGKNDYTKIIDALQNSLSQQGKETSFDSESVFITHDKKITVFPFTSNMLDVYQKADIAVSRAGALSLAELEANQIPAIIIPLPKSAGNHQFLNAVEQERKNKGVLIKQEELSAKVLTETVKTMKNNLTELIKNMPLSEHLTATSTIVNTIINDIQTKNAADFVQNNRAEKDSSILGNR